jgi:hypothetical protein
MGDIANALNKEDVSVELAGIFDFIRKTRNDVGHPTGRPIDRDEVLSLLLLFPTYYQVASEVSMWLSAHPI